MKIAHTTNPPSVIYGIVLVDPNTAPVESPESDSQSNCFKFATS